MELTDCIATDTVLGNGSPHERAVLVVAHPGHELRLFGWLNQAKPDVLVLTDGSGRNGRSRIESTRRLLEATGARPGPMFGAYTDLQIYRALLDGNASIFRAIALRLADLFQRGRYRMVVADPFEGYNPTHDLCRVLVNIAIQCVTRRCDQTLRNCDYPLTELSDFRGRGPSTKIRLSPEVLQRKRAVAAEYVELSGEVATLVRREGERAYDEERLRDVPSDSLPAQALITPPFYETYGERQCAMGLYPAVIRYEDHFAPIVRAVAALAGAPRLAHAQRTARSSPGAF